MSIGNRRDNQAKPLRFKSGQAYTRKQISNELGGSLISYLPRRGDIVLSGCFTLEKNPKLPYEVCYGTGPEVQKAAAILCKQSQPIPVFIKQHSGAWEYKGLFRATRLSQSPALTSRESKIAGRPIAGIIYLKEVT